MKRLNTIIKELIDLESQLYNYNDKTIKKAIDDFEKKTWCCHLYFNRHNISRAYNR